MRALLRSLVALALGAALAPWADALATARYLTGAR